MLRFLSIAATASEGWQIRKLCCQTSYTIITVQFDLIFMQKHKVLVYLLNHYKEKKKFQKEAAKLKILIIKLFCETKTLCHILPGDNIDTIKRNTQTLIDASKEIGLEVNIEKTQYMLLSCH
jgi:hypothetical protein